MPIVGAILMVLTGVAIMAFGLFLFYAWLPLLYGLVGLDIGLLLGRWLTAEVGTIAVILGLGGAIALAVAAYTLEPFRRILIGVAGGLLLGLSVSAVFGFDGRLVGSLLAVAGAIIGGFLVPRFFDLFIIVATASSGAAMIVSGIHLLLPGLGLLDGTYGAVLGRLITIALAVVGIVWQFRNIAKWVQSQSQHGEHGAPTE